MARSFEVRSYRTRVRLLLHRANHLPVKAIPDASHPVAPRTHASVSTGSTGSSDFSVLTITAP
ncbi:MAG: hypothetical protein ACP5PJ_02615, partial [Acidimicrobiales bacterium]